MRYSERMKPRAFDIYRERQAKRKARIQRMLQAGKTQSEIARSLGVTRQAINQMVARSK